MRSAPTLARELSGGGIIVGQFSDEDVDEILSILGSKEPEPSKR